MSRAWGRVGTVVLAVLVADQVTKALVDHALSAEETRKIGFGLDLVEVHNRGIAFGMLEGRTGLLAALTAIALLAVVVYFVRNYTRPWLWLPTGLLLGGALGNMVDRIREGFVIDFLDPPLWPAFNIADIAISVGVVALVLTIDAGRGDPDRAR
jgi:signal peptidase II